jgi:ubiquinone biosynthesis protein COQ9
MMFRRSLITAGRQSSAVLKTTVTSSTVTGTTLARCYHSQSHSSPIVNPKSIESTILTSALPLIPSHGFTQRSITEAIRSMNYSDSLLSALTASGSSPELQLMLHWLKFQRQQLETYVNDPESEFHSITDEYDRVAHLIKKRLEYNVPVVDHLANGIGQLVVPYNLNQGLDELHNLSDDIAFYAGDKSNDFAWYSKRMAFSSVYVLAELYMLQDSSKEFAKTWEFVEEKVNDVKEMGGWYNDVEQWGVFNAISMVNLVKSQLVRG